MSNESKLFICVLLLLSLQYFFLQLYARHQSRLCTDSCVSMYSERTNRLPSDTEVDRRGSSHPPCHVSCSFASCLPTNVCVLFLAVCSTIHPRLLHSASPWPGRQPVLLCPLYSRPALPAIEPAGQQLCTLVAVASLLEHENEQGRDMKGALVICGVFFQIFMGN